MAKDNKKEQKSISSYFNLAAFDMFGSPVAFNIRGDESYKTIIGCLWTLIMIGIMGGAFVYYSLIYWAKNEVEITSKTLVDLTFPRLDFKDSNFTFSIYGTQGNKIMRPEMLASTLSFEALLYEMVSTKDETTGERSEPEITATYVPMVSCHEIAREVDGKALTGNIEGALSVNALCLQANFSDPDSKFYVEGNDNSDNFAFVTFRVNPCSSEKKECFYYYRDVNTTTFDTKRTEFIQAFGMEPGSYANPPSDIQKWGGFIDDFITAATQKTYLTFNYMEATLNPQNYSEPFDLTMKSTIKAYTSLNSIKYINLYFRTIQVETDVGIVQEDMKTESQISFDMVYSDGADRSIDASRTERRPGGESKAIPSPFMEFTLLSSNNRLVYTRKYMKILDVFANVGGFSQVIAFIIVFMYAWFNSIKMEESLLNYGVLGKKEGHEMESWEKSRYFDFWELVKFGFIEKGFCCCSKRDKKYQLYKKASDSYTKRTDVIQMMQNLADIENLKAALLKPYQLKLLGYTDDQDDNEQEYQNNAGPLKETNKLDFGLHDNSDEDDHKDPDDMSVNDAIQHLNNSSKNLNVVQKAVDDYLKKHLPKEILMGRSDLLNIGKSPSKQINSKNPSHFDMHQHIEIQELDIEDNQHAKHPINDFSPAASDKDIQKAIRIPVSTNPRKSKTFKKRNHKQSEERSNVQI